MEILALKLIANSVEQSPRKFNILEACYKLIQNMHRSNVLIFKKNSYIFRASLARHVVFQNIKTLLMCISLN
jgi:F0F1-type ATP synthase membrane subunit a